MFTYKLYATVLVTCLLTVSISIVSGCNNDHSGGTSRKATTDAGAGTGAGGLGSGPGSVELGGAGDFVILSKSGVSTTGVTSITGDVGTSPAGGTLLTGFSEVMDASGQWSTSVFVSGRLFAADYTAPTPTNLTTAVTDMETAYTDAAGRAADYTELAAGNIGGYTLAPAVYSWGTGVSIPTDLTLHGGASDVWIFQIAQNLTVSSAVEIILSGGALPENIYWQVAGDAEIGTTAKFKGVILCQTLIAVKTNASVNGRLYAQAAVTLQSNSVTAP